MTRDTSFEDIQPALYFSRERQYFQLTNKHDLNIVFWFIIFFEVLHVNFTFTFIVITNIFISFLSKARVVRLVWRCLNIFLHDIYLYVICPRGWAATLEE